MGGGRAHTSGVIHVDFSLNFWGQQELQGMSKNECVSQVLVNETPLSGWAGE